MKSFIFLLVLLLIGSFSYADDNFFVSKGEFTTLSTTQSQNVSNLWSRETTSDLRTSHIEVDFLKNKVQFNLNLFPNKSVPTLQKEIVKNTNGYTWKGILPKSSGSAIIVVSGKDATGTIYDGEQMYRISPVGAGLHAITKVDMSKFPQDHPPAFATINAKSAEDEKDFSAQNNAPKDAQILNGSYVVKLLVAYTASAASASGNINNLIQLAVAETNDSYRNSGINIRLQLVHSYRVNYRESGFNTDLSRFRSSGDGHMDEVHSKRNQYKADVCVIIINDGSSCGLAYVNASSSYAFGAVHHNCATGYYSFAHEIGHIQGARHNPEVDPSNSPYPYAHGYQNSGARWRTIMAYNCPSGCTRIKHWSNPSKRYNGAVMGTSSKHNNARVLNNTANKVSNFR